jgi:hypothetical protein
MNPAQPIPGAMTPAGGNLFPLTPLWYPPVATKWILTVLIVFAGSVANRFSKRVRSMFTNPIGFFVTAVLAIVIYESGFPPGAFAILYLLLMMWATQISSKEGFLNASNTIDWVTNSKRWYVEKTLKERPLGIQDKDVATFPIQGASAQGTTMGTS